MRLIGAKEFLRTVKPGTLFIQYWKTENECKKIIRDFENDLDITKKYYGGYHLFGDNSGSMTFLLSEESDYIEIDNKTYDCLFYYDCNIVGDADPTATVYLVFDDIFEWPDKIKVEDTEDEYLTKEELIKIREWFITENMFSDNSRDSAFLESKDYYKDDEIVNYKKSLGGKNDFYKCVHS